MSAPSIRTPRSRPPGFATTRTDETSRGVVARETPTTPASETDSETSENGRAETPRRPAARPPRQPTTNRAPTESPVASKPPASDESAYAGAATRQFNTRLLQPLHRRYMRLVRDLADEGYETSMTELVHALLHEGPTTTAEARARIRAWRQLRAAE
jgi:hypothetical protein